MGMFSGERRRSAMGPPPLVVALLAVEAIAVIVLAAFGVSLADLVKSAGPVITVTLAFLNPTLQELGRRRARLAFDVAGADTTNTVTTTTLSPWPIALERVVANELAAARETVNVPRSLTIMMLSHDPFAIPPSEREYDRAREIRARPDRVRG